MRTAGPVDKSTHSGAVFHLDFHSGFGTTAELYELPGKVASDSDHDIVYLGYEVQPYIRKVRWYPTLRQLP